jgi:hypothetical protein
MSKYIIKTTYLEKSNRLRIWNGVSTFYADKMGYQGTVRNALKAVKKNNLVMIFLLS